MFGWEAAAHVILPGMLMAFIGPGAEDEHRVRVVFAVVCVYRV